MQTNEKEKKIENHFVKLMDDDVMQSFFFLKKKKLNFENVNKNT